MLDYKKYVLELLEDNKELVKDYAAKIGVIEKDSENLYLDLLSRCYLMLSEYDKLAIHFTDGDKLIAQQLYEEFKMDQRVQFWINDSMLDNLENVWVDDLPAKATGNPIAYDYGDYRLNEKTMDRSKVLLLSNPMQTNEKYGYLPGVKKEKNLCKFISKFIKEKKEITILCSEKNTLLYMKGIMKGAEVLNKNVTFAVLDRDPMLSDLRREMYSVLPVIRIEEDMNWNRLKEKVNKYWKEMNEELKQLKKKY